MVLDGVGSGGIGGSEVGWCCMGRGGIRRCGVGWVA